MANHKSALKRNRQSLVHREKNRATKSRLKKVIKAVNVAVEQKQAEDARTALAVAVPIIAKAAQGTIHKKNASRNISRLTRRVNSITQ